MAGKSIEEQLANLNDTAAVYEPPAEVRGFAKRTRNLWAALRAEGMEPMEVSNLLAMPMVIHLNGPDLPEED